MFFIQLNNKFGMTCFHRLPPMWLLAARSYLHFPVLSSTIIFLIFQNICFDLADAFRRIFLAETNIAANSFIFAYFQFNSIRRRLACIMKNKKFKQTKCFHLFAVLTIIEYTIVSPSSRYLLHWMCFVYSFLLVCGVRCRQRNKIEKRTLGWCASSDTKDV